MALVRCHAGRAHPAKGRGVTNDETIMREVDQALAEDQTSKTLTKNLPIVIGAALLVVAGVGGWQLWSAQRAAASAKTSAAFDEALKKSGTDEGTKELQSIANGSGAYAALAKMRLAGELAAKNEREKALELYRAVYSGNAGSKRVKDMARIRASYLSLQDGREAVLKDLGDLETDKTALGFYARESIALAALKAGDYQGAEQMFRTAASTPEAPEPIRLRAGEFAALAGVGTAGVELPPFEASTKSEVDRYLEGLQQAGSDLSSVVEGGAQEPAANEPVADDAAPSNPESHE